MHKKTSHVGWALLALALFQNPRTVVAQSEGIKVHGSWTIDVRAPDGTLVTHREFENALVSNGRSALAGFLGRSHVVGAWRIEIAATTNPPCADATGPHSCYITEATSPVFNGGVTYPHFFGNLTLSMPTSGADAHKVVMEGSAKAAQAGQISVVHTAVGHCPAANPSCGYTAFSFTEAQLASPIPVVKDQIIQVTVKLSFQ